MFSLVAVATQCGWTVTGKFLCDTCSLYALLIMLTRKNGEWNHQAWQCCDTALVNLVKSICQKVKASSVILYVGITIFCPGGYYLACTLQFVSNLTLNVHVDILVFDPRSNQHFVQHLSSQLSPKSVNHRNGKCEKRLSSTKTRFAKARLLFYIFSWNKKPKSEEPKRFCCNCSEKCIQLSFCKNLQTISSFLWRCKDSSSFAAKLAVFQEDMSYAILPGLSQCCVKTLKSDNRKRKLLPLCSHTDYWGKEHHYQNYTVQFLTKVPPLDIFLRLILPFETSNDPKHCVGVPTISSVPTIYLGTWIRRLWLCFCSEKMSKCLVDNCSKGRLW